MELFAALINIPLAIMLSTTTFLVTHLQAGNTVVDLGYATYQGYVTKP